ncbi:uncharacterized protein LOC142584895 isoform X1 [Dermacentor variabilis]|uniref:uncharacterized protein LOC142584895 isoform X1 n=1 Tax=Dermacentor variabilis TaxID=34621 RepID=UPI003F5C945B
MPSQMVDVVWVKPKRTVVVSEATRGSRRLALHRLRASLIGENGRLPQANSDAAQSLQWGTEDSRSQGGEEPAKKGRAGGKNGKTEASSSGMPRNKRISPAAARWMPAVLQEPWSETLGNTRASSRCVENHRKMVRVAPMPWNRGNGHVAVQVIGQDVSEQRGWTNSSGGRCRRCLLPEKKGCRVRVSSESHCGKWAPSSSEQGRRPKPTVGCRILQVRRG